MIPPAAFSRQSVDAGEARHNRGLAMQRLICSYPLMECRAAAAAAAFWPVDGLGRLVGCFCLCCVASLAVDRLLRAADQRLVGRSFPLPLLCGRVGVEGFKRSAASFAAATFLASDCRFAAAASAAALAFAAAAFAFSTALAEVDWAGFVTCLLLAALLGRLVGRAVGRGAFAALGFDTGRTGAAVGSVGVGAASGRAVVGAASACWAVLLSTGGKDPCTARHMLTMHRLVRPQCCLQGLFHASDWTPGSAFVLPSSYINLRCPQL